MIAPEKYGSYQLFFKHANETYCIDATCEPDEISFGRLINHSRAHPNLCPKKFIIDGIPVIVFLAKKDIDINEELFWDYAEKQNKELAHCDWAAT